MKLITAVVRPQTFERLWSEFQSMPEFAGLTEVDCVGLGSTPVANLADVLDPLKRYKRIDLAVLPENVPIFIEKIKHISHTGKKGDGIIMVTELEGFVRI
ncbi:MAG: P-II family nitrogen regulator [Pyrinomonadaceae bacterium]